MRGRGPATHIPCRNSKYRFRVFMSYGNRFLFHFSFFRLPLALRLNPREPLFLHFIALDYVHGIHKYVMAVHMHRNVYPIPMQSFYAQYLYFYHACTVLAFHNAQKSYCVWKWRVGRRCGRRRRRYGHEQKKKKPEKRKLWWAVLACVVFINLCIVHSVCDVALLLLFLFFGQKCHFNKINNIFSLASHNII